jgi:hypothetical protein
MIVTIVTAASTVSYVNDALIVHNTYFTNLSDYNCSDSYLKLRRIQLFNNNLSSLEGTGLSDARSLLHLQVVHNLLTSLDPDLLSNLTELTFLDLSHNKLQSFNNEQIFASQSKLEVLILSYNKIAALDLRVLAPLGALKELNLTKNPFRCDCELRYTVKWCEEKNLSTGATCRNEVPWTDFSYENCTSDTFVPIGTGIDIVIIASVVAAAVVIIIIIIVWVCCSRRTRRATFGTESAYPEDTSDNVSSTYYQTIPDNHQTFPSSCCARAYLLKPAVSSSSFEYAPRTQRQGIHHTESSSKPGTEAGVAASPAYEEPYRLTSDATGMYAVPYAHHHQYHYTTAKTGESKISDENVFCTESNNEVHSEELSIRNSLYSQM